MSGWSSRYLVPATSDYGNPNVFAGSKITSVSKLPNTMEVMWIGADESAQGITKAFF